VVCISGLGGLPLGNRLGALMFIARVGLVDLLVCPFGWLFWLGTGFYMKNRYRAGLGIATGSIV
jgi:hypothetical protein